jgi:HlyD family secretion protein
VNFTLHSTTAPSSAVLPPGAQDLPRLQKPARRRLSPAKIFGGALAVAVATGGVVLFSVPGMSKPINRLLFNGSNVGVITTKVRKGPLPITVVEKGSLESSENKDAYCNVEGQTTIIMIKPEGTPVKQGEVVCLLDSASLRDQLVNQKITTKSAEANYENAKLTREVAEIAVVEYVEGIFKQDEQTVDGEIKLAEADLSRSEDRLAWAERMYSKGYVSKAALTSEQQTLKKARFALEQAQSKRKVLLEYTKSKTIKELKSEVEKTRSDELAKKATWELEVGKEKKLERQIAACEIKAPADGLVVYANDPSRAFGSNQPQIEEGATVRERQKIFSLPDISRMQVNTKVHESQIDKLAKGMKAKIRVDAFASETLEGTVTDVAPLPDSTNFFSSDIKVYTTKVRIDNPLSGLKPGMTAEVEILVDRKTDVLTVPVLAVLQFHGKDHVSKRIEDQFVQTEVELGVSNEAYVQIVKGVSEGDVIAMSPMSLMSDEEKRKAFGAATKGGKKDWGEEGGSGEPGQPGVGGPGVTKKVAAGPGAAGKEADAAKAKAKGKGAGGFAKGKGAGGNRPAFFTKLQKLSQDERTQLRSPDTSEEEKSQLYKKAGLTDEELTQMAEMRKNFGGGGGPGGGGGRRGGAGGGRRGGDGGGGEDQ